MSEWRLHRATSVGFLPSASSMFTSALSNFVSYSSRKCKTVMLLPVVPVFASAWCSISNFIISICPNTALPCTASFSANHSRRSLFLSSSALTAWIPQFVYCYFWAYPFSLINFCVLHSLTRVGFRAHVEIASHIVSLSLWHAHMTNFIRQCRQCCSCMLRRLIGCRYMSLSHVQLYIEPWNCCQCVLHSPRHHLQCPGAIHDGLLPCGRYIARVCSHWRFSWLSGAPA